MKIKIDGNYQTRDGREVRIYAVDGRSDYPNHGAILTDIGWCECSWNKHGNFVSVNDANKSDLVEKPEIIEGWVNVYPNTCGVIYPTKQQAIEGGSPNRIACIPIKFTVGEGIDNE